MHHFNEPDQEAADRLVVVQPEPVETVFPEEGFELQDYSPSIELLKEAGILNEIEERPVVTTLKNPKHSKSKLSGIVKSLIAKRNAQESHDASHSHMVFLEPLKQTRNAVFQTLSDVQLQKTMGQRYAELVKARNLGTAFVGPDNLVVEPGNPTRSYSPAPSTSDKKNSSYRPHPNARFKCTRCPVALGRMQRILEHMKKVHNMPQWKVDEDRETIAKWAQQIKLRDACKDMPTVEIYRLTDEDIAYWTWTDSDDDDDHEETEISSSFKLAIENLTTNLTVSIPRISPSKLPTSVEHSDESDDEVMINPIKRSRSTSPSTSSSSKEENSICKSNLPSEPKRSRRNLVSKPEVKSLLLNAKSMSRNSSRRFR